MASGPTSRAASAPPRARWRPPRHSTRSSATTRAPRSSRTRRRAGGRCASSHASTASPRRRWTRRSTCARSPRAPRPKPSNRSVGTDARLLAAIERYCDGVPRSSADTLDLGPFTIFVSRIPWRYYARPRLGLDLAVSAEDVAAARERQRAEGVPERFEWIAEMTPSLAGAAQAAGLNVTRVPLMALEAAAWRPAPAPEGVQVRVLSADD